MTLSPNGQSQEEENSRLPEKKFSFAIARQTTTGHQKETNKPGNRTFI
jgi:hypothetical protein